MTSKEVVRDTAVPSRERYEALCRAISGRPPPGSGTGLDAPEFATARFEDWSETKFIMNPPSMQEGIYTCRKCHSKKTQSWSKQTRSLDEPATTFVMCVECSHRWNARE